jgi:ABC-type Fe3+-hydroxamate transport system substrate-binding protein
VSRTLLDPLGRLVALPTWPPQRIISLCPSITETLFALGAGDRVMGRTQWCIHPQPEIETVPTVGGTKKVNLRRVRELQPDLIICEKEENTREMVEALAPIAPTYVTNVESIEDAHSMLGQLAELLDVAPQATALSDAIQSTWAYTPTRATRVAYLIWREPWMAAGDRTYIHSVLNHLGFDNVFAGREARYPTFSLGELRALAPERILLSSEPFAFSQVDVDRLAADLPGVSIDLVDGELFCWYGARMLPSAKALSAYVGTLLGKSLTV